MHPLVESVEHAHAHRVGVSNSLEAQNYDPGVGAVPTFLRSLFDTRVLFVFAACYLAPVVHFYFPYKGPPSLMCLAGSLVFFIFLAVIILFILCVMVCGANFGFIVSIRTRSPGGGRFEDFLDLFLLMVLCS